MNKDNNETSVEYTVAFCKTDFANVPMFMIYDENQYIC